MAEWNLGMCLSRQWWEKPDLDIMEIILGKVAMEEMEETVGK